MKITLDRHRPMQNNIEQNSLHILLLFTLYLKGTIQQDGSGRN